MNPATVTTTLRVPTIFDEVQLTNYSATNVTTQYSVLVNERLVNVSNNGTKLQHAPQLTQAAMVRVYVLCVLGIISLVGNVATIWNIGKTRTIRRNSRHTWSAIYMLILHLSIADLLVTIFCIFGEACWSFTVQWVAGELACKLVKFIQMFSLYLSTYVLVLIGIDRFVAVKYPLWMKSLNMTRRCHHLLILAYVLSLLLSLPQVRICDWEWTKILRFSLLTDNWKCQVTPFFEDLYHWTSINLCVVPNGISDYG